MSAVKASKFLLTAVVALGAAVVFAQAQSVATGGGPGVNGARYATDAYPGFDDTEEMTKPERKEPKWLGFIFGPHCDSVEAQFSHCMDLISEEDYKKACKELDALVREWPTAPEASKAQRLLSDLLFDKLEDYEEAFSAYRYLLDFYSSSCDYEKMSDRLYQVAGMMKIEGKEVMFVRFANTVEVRRAYETCILRAPGAKWVPEAMMTVGALREDEGKYEQAALVYENVRNMFPEAPEAKAALVREAEARMVLLRERGYNRARCRDTVAFLRLAIAGCRPEDAATLKSRLTEAETLLEEDAYQSAYFYDSSTRTRRSAVTAYERYLAEYPDGAHADAVRARLEQLREVQK